MIKQKGGQMFLLVCLLKQEKNVLTMPQLNINYRPRETSTIKELKPKAKGHVGLCASANVYLCGRKTQSGPAPCFQMRVRCCRCALYFPFQCTSVQMSVLIGFIPGNAQNRTYCTNTSLPARHKHSVVSFICQYDSPLTSRRLVCFHMWQ